MEAAKTEAPELAPIAKYIEGIADRGSTYALIALGGLAGAVAILDRLVGSQGLSTTEFIVVLGLGGALMLFGALLQFMTENAIRASVASAQEVAGQEAAAAADRYLRSLELAQEAGEENLREASRRYVEAMGAINRTNTYAAHLRDETPAG